MRLIKFISGSILAIAASTALATPQYYGDTDAPSITSSQMDTGYYIWNDDDNANNWHIRWTSTDAVEGNYVNWFGDIVIEGHGLTSASSFLFENSGTYADNAWVGSMSTVDFISWEAATNDNGGIDGIDFSIDNTVDTIEFNLGSSLFASLEESTNDPGVVGTNIFIGDSFANPNVLVYDSLGGTYQTFEVKVPEPGSLALLGLGLIGLGLARRKQA